MSSRKGRLEHVAIDAELFDCEVAIAMGGDRKLLPGGWWAGLLMPARFESPGRAVAAGILMYPSVSEPASEVVEIRLGSRKCPGGSIAGAVSAPGAAASAGLGLVLGVPLGVATRATRRSCSAARR